MNLLVLTLNLEQGETSERLGGVDWGSGIGNSRLVVGLEAGKDKPFPTVVGMGLVSADMGVMERVNSIINDTTGQQGSLGDALIEDYAIMKFNKNLK